MVSPSDKIVWNLRSEVMTEMAREGLLTYHLTLGDDPSEIEAKGKEQIEEVFRRICERTGIDEKRVRKILHEYTEERYMYGKNADSTRTYNGLRWPKRGEVGIPGIHHIHREIRRGEWRG